jgi:hypothetical protein
VTRHPIEVLEDGTRVYSNGVRYTPKAEGARLYARRKPPDEAVEGFVRFAGVWLPPLPLLPPEARSWPETRPDTDAYHHMTKPRKCRCYVCLRPESQRWKDLWTRGLPLRF